VRLAYLVLSHDNRPQVVRLAETLLANDPECDVVIHHDTGGGSLAGCVLETQPRVHILAFERNAWWGGPRLARAMLRSLCWINDTLTPDWTVVISGQDYPTRPAADLHATLRESDADAFLTLSAVVDAARPTVPEVETWHARYYYRWYRTPSLTRSLRIPGSALGARLAWKFSWAQPLIYIWRLPRDSGTVVGIRRYRTPFGQDFQCYVGSTWFAVNRHGLQTLVDFAATRPDVTRYYARTILPDESYFQSILMNAPGVKVATPNLSHIRFDHVTSAHPATMTIADLGEIEASGVFFTRKVDGSDVALLAALDARISADTGVSPLLAPDG
jgi:hypothetical protein